MKYQPVSEKITSKEGLLSLYKNIDLEKVLKTYGDKLTDLRRCL